ncbi:Spo12 family-domain-containing protein [Pseudoneurospora amorphoporcata]|uniref:Spo12 family-domain-containing protein n=1 Tax=Pseudoneurospora amorphoporcata TaxID=241081 RepID=A0AAN6NVY6_9PEZI|nr:Spo12 family-domain-containing protein [Pseudoneurospora amorphoporcata]
MSANTVLFPKDANMAMDTTTTPSEPMDMDITTEQKPTLFAAPSADNKVTDPLAAVAKSDSMKTLEYHRQVLQNKMEIDHTKYVSPSDNIMSPCTAKLSAFRSKQAGKVKPKSLFAQASAKKLEGTNATGNTGTTNTGLFGVKKD